MLFDHRPAVFTAALVIAACSGLSACDDGSDAAVNTSAGSTPARSASGSPSYAASSAPADARPAGASADPGAVASTSPASTATAKADFSTPARTPTPTLTPTPTPTPTPASSSAACTNLTLPAAVKSAVTQVWERSKGISHIQPKPGNFYYGSCGPTLYAAVRFEAGVGATGDDLVHLQDEGSGLQFFRSTPSTGWRFVRSDTFPATDDCSRFAPVALARQWNCS